MKMSTHEDDDQDQDQEINVDSDSRLSCGSNSDVDMDGDGSCYDSETALGWVVSLLRSWRQWRLTARKLNTSLVAK